MSDEWSLYRLLVSLNINGVFITYLLEHVSQEDFIEAYLNTYRGYVLNIVLITPLSKDSFELLVQEMEPLPGVFILS